MWVLPAENPLGLGTLYVSNPLQRKEKVDPIDSLPVENLPARGSPEEPIICARSQTAARCVQESNPLRRSVKGNSTGGRYIDARQYLYSGASVRA